MEGYKVTIVETSRELSAKERVALKDTNDALKITAGLHFEPMMYAVLDVHNENNKDGDKEYKQYVIMDVTGQKYVTGSESFFTSFRDIWEEMEDEDETWEIVVNSKKSKNYAGEFFTCSIA